MHKKLNTNKPRRNVIMGIFSRKSNRRAGAFAGGKSGAAAIFFGVVALPLLLIAGVAIDYLRVAKGGGALQLAVDAATREAAKDLAAGQPYLATHLRREWVDNVAASFVRNEDGSVTGAATGEVATSVMALASMPYVTVSARATVAGAKPLARLAPSFREALTQPLGYYRERLALYAARRAPEALPAPLP